MELAVGSEQLLKERLWEIFCEFLQSESFEFGGAVFEFLDKLSTDDVPTLTLKGDDLHEIHSKQEADVCPIHFGLN